MTSQLMFWILMLLWLMFGAYGTYTTPTPNWRGWFSGSFLLWVLLALLGWKTFGPMLHG